MFSMIRTSGPYPSGIRKISGEFTGNPFFPGSYGIFTDNGKISDKKVMITGYRFEPRTDFVRMSGVSRPREKTTLAWRNLFYLLFLGGADPSGSFFTNAVPGMKEVTGAGAQPDPSSMLYFRKHSRELFQKQLDIQKPAVVLVLGIRAAKSLTWISPKLACWRVLKNYAEADRKGQSVIRDVPVAEGATASFVLLVDPVRRRANVACRRFGNATGDEAEIEMISCVMRGRE